MSKLKITRISKDGRKIVTRTYDNFWQTPVGLGVLIIGLVLFSIAGGFE